MSNGHYQWGKVQGHSLRDIGSRETSKLNGQVLTHYVQVKGGEAVSSDRVK